MKKKLMEITALVLTGALLFSACSSSDKKKDKDEDESDLNEEIVEVVDNYFGKLTDMSFSKITKYVEESSFSDLDLSSDEFDVLNAYLSKVTYEITETEAKEKKGTGKATVEVTFVDLEKAANSLDDIDAESLVDAIGAKKAKTKSEEIELDLSYDDEWIITDDAELYDLLMDSFEDIRSEIGSKPDVTTTETDEPTTTTTEEETTTTVLTPPDTSDPDSSYETMPDPGVVDRHIVSADELVSILKEWGFTVEEENANGVHAYYFIHDPDDIEFIYAEFDDPAMAKQYYEDFALQILAMDAAMFSDEWEGNTHHIYAKNIASQENHSYDFYLYRDSNSLLLGGIDEYPNADANEGYLELMQRVGLWDFGFSID